ncbi:hypothetical protein EJB05_43937, partial [Eragrostis curvula]
MCGTSKYRCDGTLFSRSQQNSTATPHAAVATPKKERNQPGAKDSEGIKNPYIINTLKKFGNSTTYRMSLHIPIFKCVWVKHPKGVRVDDYGFTIVGLNNFGHKNDLSKCRTKIKRKIKKTFEKNSDGMGIEPTPQLVSGFLNHWEISTFMRERSRKY